MAAYRRVYDSRRLQAHCQEPDQPRNPTLGKRVWVYDSQTGNIIFKQPITATVFVNIHECCYVELLQNIRIYNAVHHSATMKRQNDESEDMDCYCHGSKQLQIKENSTKNLLKHIDSSLLQRFSLN